MDKHFKHCATMVHDAYSQSLAFSREEIEQGRWLFAQDCQFLKGVVSLEGLPPLGLPEVAFCGRSNVGKSSLVNALTNRKTLAKTSNTPGRTQQLNFFNLGQTLWLVDLPGYGYASVSKSIVKEWVDVIKGYLRGRPTLKRTYLLIDARHGIKANDLEMMQLLDITASSYQLVLTKIDKISSADSVLLRNQIEKDLLHHPAAYPQCLMTSAEKGIGIDCLRAAIAQTAKI